MSGSEQFLGRQLTKQAESLALLVEKMGEMIIKQEASIPKFYKSNVDSVQHTIPRDIPINKALPFLIFGTGTVAFKINVTNTNSPNGNVVIYKNGAATVTSVTIPASTTMDLIIENYNVMENDLLLVQGSSGAYITLNDVKLCYDLLNKPNISI